MKEKAKGITTWFNTTLNNYELDKKVGQLSRDSFYSLHPSEQIMIVNVIEDLLDQIESLENVNNKLSSALNSAEQRIDKAIEYIKNNTKYYDAEYSETYKELCDIAGANDTRIHVIVGDKELLSILKGEDKEC